MDRFEVEALIGIRECDTLSRFLVRGEGEVSTAWAADAFGDLAADFGYGSFERAYWGEMARSLFSGLLPALAHLRDTGQGEFNAAGLRGQLDLRQLVKLADPDRHPTMPPSYRAAIDQYLANLPGFADHPDGRPSQTTMDHHGHLVMRVCAVLADLETIATMSKIDPMTFAAR